VRLQRIVRRCLNRDVGCHKKKWPSFTPFCATGSARRSKAILSVGRYRLHLILVFLHRGVNPFLPTACVARRSLNIYVTFKIDALLGIMMET